MSLFKRRKGNTDYRYFKKGGTAQIYLGPVGKENRQKIIEALEYMEKLKHDAVKHYNDVEDQLFALLPPKDVEEVYFLIKKGS